MMKRTTAIGTILIAGFTLAASGATTVLQQWEYDEVAGTQLNNSANTGTVGTMYPWTSAAEFATDGNGNLDVIAGTKAYKGSNTFPALTGGDTYSFEIKVAEWTIPPANTTQAKLQFRMNASPSVIEIQTLLDPVEGLGFTFVSASTNYRTHWVGGASGTDMVARVDFNIAEGWATYFVDDVEKETFAGLNMGSMTGFLMQKSGFEVDTIDPATVLKIDEQSLSVVPEPGALSLLSLVGVGLLTVRRRNGSR